mmetsp:Transcript_8920/g.33264  ORF Transcript_8920/g.33264 Transcript_8920/m.33264 type:complete len:791 (-) Transcript_8920:336-2708(-)
MRSILFRAMINGVFLERSMFNDSSVCGSKPCMISTTRIARSHREDPRERKFVNDSCPGVSMTNNPGTCKSITPLFTGSVRSRIALAGMNVAPICCVMPPASPSWTFVRRMLSKIFVFPVSTCPKMQIIGHRSLSFERVSFFSSNRPNRSFFASRIRVWKRRSCSSSLSYSDELYSLESESSDSESESESESEPDSEPESSLAESSFVLTGPFAAAACFALAAADTAAFAAATSVFFPARTASAAAFSSLAACFACSASASTAAVSFAAASAFAAAASATALGIFTKSSRLSTASQSSSTSPDESSPSPFSAAAAAASASAFKDAASAKTRSSSCAFLRSNISFFFLRSSMSTRFCGAASSSSIAPPAESVRCISCSRIASILALSAFCFVVNSLPSALSLSFFAFSFNRFASRFASSSASTAAAAASSAFSAANRAFSSLAATKHASSRRRSSSCILSTAPLGLGALDFPEAAPPSSPLASFSFFFFFSFFSLFFCASLSFSPRACVASSSSSCCSHTFSSPSPDAGPPGAPLATASVSAPSPPSPNAASRSFFSRRFFAALDSPTGVALASASIPSSANSASRSSSPPVSSSFPPEPFFFFFFCFGSFSGSGSSFGVSELGVGSAGVGFGVGAGSSNATTFFFFFFAPSRTAASISATFIGAEESEIGAGLSGRSSLSFLSFLSFLESLDDLFFFAAGSAMAKSGGGSIGAGSPIGARFGHSIIPTALAIHPISAALKSMPSDITPRKGVFTNFSPVLGMIAPTVAKITFKPALTFGAPHTTRAVSGPP